MNTDPEEERFARPDRRPYSGVSSAITIAVIVIVLVIVGRKEGTGGGL